MAGALRDRPRIRTDSEASRNQKQGGFKLPTTSFSRRAEFRFSIFQSFQIEMALDAPQQVF